MHSDGAIPFTRSLGRPVSIDPDAVVAHALTMFAERGYEQTSMEDIARESGVGRKTLYRHFANKAELVWGGMAPVIEASTPLLSEPPARGMSGDQVLVGIRDALIAGANALPDLVITRARLRLIAEYPELMSRSYEFLAGQRDRTRSYLTARGVPEKTASFLCAALIGATFEAWLQWAVGDDPAPDNYLLAALAVLRLDES